MLSVALWIQDGGAHVTKCDTSQPVGALSEAYSYAKSPASRDMMANNGFLSQDERTSPTVELMDRSVEPRQLFLNYFSSYYFISYPNVYFYSAIIIF